MKTKQKTSAGAKFFIDLNFEAGWASALMPDAKSYMAKKA